MDRGVGAPICLPDGRGRPRDRRCGVCRVIDYETMNSEFVTMNTQSVDLRLDVGRGSYAINSRGPVR